VERGRVVVYQPQQVRQDNRVEFTKAAACVPPGQVLRLVEDDTVALRKQG